MIFQKGNVQSSEHCCKDQSDKTLFALSDPNKLTEQKEALERSDFNETVVAWQPALSYNVIRTPKVETAQFHKDNNIANLLSLPLSILLVLGRGKKTNRS